MLKYSNHEDFVVFTVSGAPAVTPLATNTAAALDDPVFAVGNALGEGIVIRDGLLTSLTPEAQDGRWKWLRFSAAASPGNSGGPLLDSQGRVIGLVARKSPNENLNFALPIDRVLNATDKTGIFETRESFGITKVLRGTIVADYQADLPAAGRIPAVRAGCAGGDPQVLHHPVRKAPGLRGSLDIPAGEIREAAGRALHGVRADRHRAGGR